LGNKNNSSNSRKCVQCQETHQGETEEDNGKENGKEITFHTEIISGSSYTADSSAKNTLWQDDLIDTDDIPDSSPLTNTTACEEVFYGEEDTVSLRENEVKDLYNYDTTVNTVAYNNNGDNHSLYDWIADCASTSHICNRQEVFTEYTPIHNNVPIYGVGNTTMHAQG